MNDGEKENRKESGAASIEDWEDKEAEIDEDIAEDMDEDIDDETDAPLKPWSMVAAFAGLVILAAIICAILWHFTHLYRDEDKVPTQPESPIIMEEATPEPIPEATPEPTSEPTAAPTVVPAVDASASPTATSASAVTPTPAVSPATVTPTPAGTPASAAGTVQEPVSGTTAMTFVEAQATVMAKDVVNLRSEPSTLDAETIVGQAQNGEILTRTGINEDTGWTRIDYNGQTVYAVTQYLTEDLSYKPPVQASNPNRVNTLDGRVILFTDCGDNITPKEYVNLRTEPSTSEGESTVRCQVSNGETLHRTGYSPDAGWSRVEYNGEVLYVVSSYVYVVE